MDRDTSAPLGCAGLTSYGAVKNAGLKPDDNVVAVGTGGLGLMAIQLAKVVTGANIIAMDIDDQKLDVAKKNGANISINSKKEDPVKAVMELTDKLGADAVLDFVNASSTVETDMEFLRRRAFSHTTEATKIQMEYHGNLSSFLFQDKLFAKNSADFFKALIRLLYFVKPCPSSSKTIYSTPVPLLLNPSTI